jgi:hypothetical protein
LQLLQQLLQVEQSAQPQQSLQLEQQVDEQELQAVLQQDVSDEQQDAKAAGTRSIVTSQTRNMFFKIDFIVLLLGLTSSFGLL